MIPDIDFEIETTPESKKITVCFVNSLDSEYLKEFDHNGC